jgi:diaminopimelate decarboxylase
MFAYRDGVLHAEDVDVSALADRIGTPFYLYSEATLRENYRRYATALAALHVEICYAVKANGHLAVIRSLVREGAGADVVSMGEAQRALAAGCPAGRIVFSGVAKTADELRFAIEAGLAQVNIESVPELEALGAIAASLGRRVTAALRVNPDVDAKTHAKITTGRAENKFGIDIDEAPAVFARARSMPWVDLRGVAVHIGSQLLDLAPYRDAYRRVADLVTQLRGQGHVIDRIDLGGGLGLSYRGEPRPSLDDYAAIVAGTVGGLGCALTIEPGRSLVGDAGLLVSRVVYVKEGKTRRFLILDAGMNDLLRPALYDAYHEIVPVRAPAPGAATSPYDVVGPICESGDTFAKGRLLPPLAAGDLVAFENAGAYGAAMASTYNGRPLTAEVMIFGSRFALIRNRPHFERMIAGEELPPWLH